MTIAKLALLFYILFNEKWPVKVRISPSILKRQKDQKSFYEPLNSAACRKITLGTLSPAKLVWNTCGFSRQLSDLIYLHIFMGTCSIFSKIYFWNYFETVPLKIQERYTSFLEFLRSMIFTNVFLNKYFVFNYFEKEIEVEKNYILIWIKAGIAHSELAENLTI